MMIVKIFLNTCRKHLFQVLALVAVIIMIVSLQLLPPQLLRKIVDDYLNKGIYDGIIKMAAFYLAAVMFSYFADFLKTTLTVYIGQKTMLGIRNEMSDKLLKLPISYYSKNPVGDIMSRFTQDVEAVNTLFSSGIINMIVDLFKIVGIVISVLFISGSLFVYSLLIIPVVVFLSFVFRKLVFESQKKIRRLIGKMNAFFQESYSGLKLFKIYGMEKRLSEALDPLIDDQKKTMTSIFRINNSFQCIMQFLRALAICIFVILTTKEVNIIAGITIGSIAAIVDLLGKLFAPIEALAQEYQVIQQALAALTRIEEFISEKEEQRDAGKCTDGMHAPEETDKIITFNTVMFGYESGKRILNGVSISIKRGMKVAFAGRTGAGKTTILNLLAGLYPPESGEILLSGYDPFKIPAKLRRRIVGIVPQSVYMFTGTIKEILMLGDDDITMDDIRNALEIVNLKDKIEALPEKYDTVIGEGEKNFSNGEMQLLALARAIVTDPPILLLDELTSGLDTVTEAKLLDVIRKVSAERTIVTISHRLSGLIDADYVYILSKGEIVEEGTPELLSSKDGWYAKYSQLESMSWQA